MASNQAKTYEFYFTRFKEVDSNTLSQLIKKLANSSCPVNGIVYDPYLHWAVEVAKKFCWKNIFVRTKQTFKDKFYCIKSQN